GKFYLDSPARWGAATLPAGSYTLSIDSTQMPMRGTVRSDDGKTVAIVSTSLVDPLAAKRSFIFITGTGSQRRVQSLNLSTIGTSLVFEPLTKAQKEEYSMQIQSGADTVTLGQE